MSFKMKGSPAKMGTIQGTAGHSSALKKKEEEDIKTLLAQREASRKKQEELKEKEEARDAIRESGKKVFLGNLKTRINKKKVEKAEEKEKEIQDKINVNPDAIKWKEDAEKKNTNQDDDGDIDYDYITKGGITGGYISSPVDLHGSPAKDLKSPPHRHPHPDDKTQEAQRKQEEEYVPSKKTQEVVKSTGKTKTKKTKSTKNEEKLNKLYNKRASLKSEGGDVEGGDGVDRKLRRVQNKINRLLDDPTRHKRNIFTGGKYKKVVKN